MIAIPASYFAAGRLAFQKFGIRWSVSWGGAGYTGPNTGTTGQRCRRRFRSSLCGCVAFHFDFCASLQWRGQRHEHHQRRGLLDPRRDGDFHQQCGRLDHTDWRDAFTHAHADATPSPTPGPTPSTLGNISTRLRVLSGDNALIGGMIATGTAGQESDHSRDRALAHRLWCSRRPGEPDARSFPRQHASLQ